MTAAVGFLSRACCNKFIFVVACTCSLFILFVVLKGSQIYPLRDPGIITQKSILENEVGLTNSSHWVKYSKNPVLGGQFGVIFDVTLLRDDLSKGGTFYMWSSWRSRGSIALSTSSDGLNFSNPVEVYPGNRPFVLDDGTGTLHMWYTFQNDHSSVISYARSIDRGMSWKLVKEGVITPTEKWELNNVMCPSVIWEKAESVYKMWYSGGEMMEPNAIGFASSSDGITWKKRAEPVLTKDPTSFWEGDRVTAAHVFRHKSWYIAFYIGFSDIHTARIGIARSRDGLKNWVKHCKNPIIFGTPNEWDAEATYKPFVLYDEPNKRWLLWYNGRRGGTEQIGVAIFDGEEFWE